MPQLRSTKEEDEAPKAEAQATGAQGRGVVLQAQDVPPSWLASLLEAQDRRSDALLRTLCGIREQQPRESIPLPHHRRSPAASPPTKLSSSVTLRDFRVWCTSWDDYAKLTHLHESQRDEQLAELRMCLSDNMRALLQHAIGVDNEVDDVNSILKKIEGYLREQKNVTIDRVKFEERQQLEGESFDAFLIALKQLSGEAELCNGCLDQRLTTRIISGIRDAATRRRLLAIRPFPALSTAIDICRSEEAAKRNDAELTSAPKLSISSASSGYRVTRQRDSACRNCGGLYHSDMTS